MQFDAFPNHRVESSFGIRRLLRIELDPSLQLFVRFNFRFAPQRRAPDKIGEERFSSRATEPLPLKPPNPASHSEPEQPICDESAEVRRPAVPDLARRMPVRIAQLPEQSPHWLPL